MMHGRFMGFTTDHLTTNYSPTYYSPLTAPHLTTLPYYPAAYEYTTSLLATHLPIVDEEGERHATKVEGDPRRVGVVRLREVTQLVAPEASGWGGN